MMEVREPRPPPPAYLVHLVLIIVQVSFGGGAIVGKFGVHGTNPVLFALVREGIAGPLLCLYGMWATRDYLPPRSSMPRLIIAALAIWSNQLFFILGIKLSDPVSGSAWQPSQPIFTTMLAVILGYEQLSLRKSLGILVAVGGAVFMAVCGASAEAGSSGALVLVGHLLFFLNCWGTSCYVIVIKELLKRHQSISVIGWAYSMASGAMLATTLVVGSSSSLLSFVCHDKDPGTQQACVDGAWSVPAAMIWPLAYWIIFSSIIAYFGMTWANRYAKASVVSGYTVLQPATSSLLSVLLVVSEGRDWAQRYGLSMPGVQLLGLIGIFLGLGVLFSEPTMDPAAGPAAGAGENPENDCLEAPGGSKDALTADAGGWPAMHAVSAGAPPGGGQRGP